MAVAVRDCDGIWPVVRASGVLAGDAESRADDGARRGAHHRAQSGLLVRARDSFSGDHGVRRAPSAESHKLAAAAAAARGLCARLLHRAHRDHDGHPRRADGQPGTREARDRLVDVGPSRISEPARLAADDVPVSCRRGLRPRLPAPVRGARAERVAARDAARRSAAPVAAAATASALPLQHAQHDLRPHSNRSRRRGRDDRPPGRPPAYDAPQVWHSGSAAQGGARRAPEVRRDRADALRQPSQRRDAH